MLSQGQHDGAYLTACPCLIAAVYVDRYANILPAATLADCGLMQERMTLLERLEQRPLKVRAKDDQDAILRALAEEDLELLVDVRPFMQRNPFIVHADASLSRAYRLFRTMGLRHLFVCEPQPKVRFLAPGTSTTQNIGSGKRSFASKMSWPSGLRRWSKVPVRKGASSNLADITHQATVANAAFYFLLSLLRSFFYILTGSIMLSAFHQAASMAALEAGLQHASICM